jgi:TolB-like protein
LGIHEEAKQFTRTRMKRILVCILLGLHCTAVLYAEAEKRVNRRVLLLDFVNQTSNKEAAYLSISIPEAYIDPLQKTGVFEVMNRSEGQRQAQEYKLSAQDLYNEENAVRIGKALSAEVIVVGNYVIVGASVQIQAKAIDVSQGRIAVAKSVQAKLDSTIFTSINKLAEDMSANMKTELPPLPQREVVREKASDSGDGQKAPRVRGPWYYGVSPGVMVLFPDSNFGFGPLDTDPGFAISLGAGKNFNQMLSLGGEAMVGFSSNKQQGFNCGTTCGTTGATAGTVSDTYIHGIAMGKFFPFSGGFSLQFGAGVGWFKYTTAN